jgi:hypothetical protein
MGHGHSGSGHSGLGHSGLDAFDADVLIYAAVPGHPLGSRVAALFPVKSPGKSSRRDGIGSAPLLP